MLATMYLNQMDTKQRLQGSFAGSFIPLKIRKNLFALLSIMLLTIGSSFVAQAQVLQVDYSPAPPNPICEGNPAIINITPVLGLPLGVTVTKYTVYFMGSIEPGDTVQTTPPNFLYQIAVRYTPGVYHPYVVATLSNGTKVTSNIMDLTVYYKPIPFFVNLTADVQCFKGNNVCLQNLSTRAPFPSTPIKQYIWEYGDAFYDSLTSPVDVCHSYGFPDQFIVGLRVIDSLGCQKDTFLPPANPIIIKKELTPKFSWIARSGPCYISNYLFTNATPISIDELTSYRWEFGDDSIYEAFAPFTFEQRAYFDSIGHDYTVNGEFTPFITVTDTTGCTDSIRYTNNNSPGIPKNIVFDFDMVTYASPIDASSRDSVCIGSGNGGVVCFRQTPIQFAGPGDFLWTFDDPASMQENTNRVSWEPCHAFAGGLGTYYVTLAISNVCPGQTITHTYTAGRTFWDNKYIDKFLYHNKKDAIYNNDTLSTESRPVLFRDTVNYSKYKKPLLSLVYMNSYNVSEGDTLYEYSIIGKQRPVYYLGDSLAINKATGLVKDSIVVQPNWRSIVPIPNTNPQAYDTFAGYNSYGYGTSIIGPFARIEKPTPPPPVLVAPQQKNQCGPTDTVKFVNTSLYYKSRKMYRRWDFGDDFAPQCTSFSVPKFGFPPVVSTNKLDSITFDNGKSYRKLPADTVRMWATAEQQFANSNFYFISNGATYEGKMNCKFSYDTLPNHHYPNWDTVSRWYNYGKDFLPWDLAQYGPPGSGKPRIVHPNDTAWWGKPIFLNPATGEWSLTQGTGPAPFGLWTRIDTMKLGINNDQDLESGEQITITNLPDPFRSGLVDDKGKYNIIPGGTVKPTNQTTYYDKTRDTTYTINGYDLLPNSTMTFYQYAFMRTVVKCINVRLRLHDSLNNETTKGIMLDEEELDIADCNMEAVLQLSFARADAHGLGKSGKECPGGDPKGVINFELAGVGDFPGTKPECGQTFILMNFDSLADRFDNTPCALDAFVTWTGTGTGTTAGGLSFPMFFPTPNFFPMPWTSPSGTKIVYHYGLNAPNNRPAPADTAQGFITIGLVIGSGCKDTVLSMPEIQYYSNLALYGTPTAKGSILDTLNPATINILVPYNTGNVPVPGARNRYNYSFSQLKNFRLVLQNGNYDPWLDVEYTDCSWPKCLSDTVWYHRFLRIQNLTSRFDVEPVACRLRHVGEEITSYYEDSVQDNIRYSEWNWGDKTVTVDSFFYAPGGQNITDGYYTNGYRRVRYNFDFISGVGVLIDSTVWPVRSPAPGVSGLLPRVLADTVLADNFNRIFTIMNRTAVTDSIIIRDKCSMVIDTIANKDTMQYYPLSQIIDTALMFLPVKHKFVRSSWEAAGKGPGSRVQLMVHSIRSNNDCSQESFIPMVIGIIDTFAINNGDGVRDTLYCQEEPVYFVDSIRYWRADCSITSAQLNPAISMSPAYKGVLSGTPYNSYQFDSADFWRQDFGDPRVIQDIVTRVGYQGRNTIDTVVAERVYWDFGDGSPVDSTLRPVHRYKTFGRFTVRMVTKDSLRGWDTCYGYLNISVPAAKIGFILDAQGLPKDNFNCGDFADMIDSSRMDPSTTLAGLDSVKTNYWWFGDDLIDTVPWQTKNNFFPKWPYRTNGSFRVKLVSESFLGCKDTTYDTIFIKGPRPEFRPGDTIGCVPFTVTIYNMADSSGKYVDANGNTNASDTPTVTTYFSWGDGTPYTIVTGRRDTIQYTYTKPGKYQIYAWGVDAPPGVQNTCDWVAFPDTSNRPPITVEVMELNHEVLADKQVVCKDPELLESSPITITNNSDPAYFGEYNYYIQRVLDSTNVDTTARTTLPDNFTQRFPDTGYYRVIAVPGFVKIIDPSIQDACKVPDTLNVRVVSPYPAFEIDTMETPKYTMINKSDTSLNNRYEWVAYKQGTTQVLFSSSGTNANPNFTFDLENDTGTFVVCLTAFATGIDISEACADSVCQLIKNTYNVDLQIPNVFSPNGDNRNDVVRIPHESVERFKMTIYNRWGAKVFETTDVEVYWNGKVKNDGAECPAGVYYFIAEYKLRGLEEKNRTGTITLMR